MDGMGKGCVQKKRGKWQGVVRVYEYTGEPAKIDGGIPPKRWRKLTKVFDIPSYPGNNRGKREAERALRAWVDALLSKKDERTEVRSGTVGEWVKAQIDNKELSGAIGPHTVDTYRLCLKYIDGSEFNGKRIDGIGGIRLEKLTREQVQSWVNQIAAQYSVPTTRKALMVLKDVGLKKAVLDHRIEFNPAEGVEVAPTPQPKEPNYLDATQRARVLELLSGEGRRGVAAECGLLAGLREGEVCALRWRDVDLDSGILKVTGTINRKGGRCLDSRTLKTKDTKNAGSARSIPLSGRLLADLKRIKARTREECLAGGLAFSESLYVFGFQDGGFLKPQNLYRWWSIRANRWGLVGSQGRVCTFHDLRHTFATTAIGAGVDVKSVSSILGHANAAMTLNIYASSDPEAKRRAMGAVDRAMAAAQPAEVLEMEGTGTYGR